MGPAEPTSRLGTGSPKRNTTPLTARTMSDDAPSPQWPAFPLSMPKGGCSSPVYFFFGFSTEMATASV